MKSKVKNRTDKDELSEYVTFVEIEEIVEDRKGRIERTASVGQGVEVVLHFARVEGSGRRDFVQVAFDCLNAHLHSVERRTDLGGGKQPNG